MLDPDRKIGGSTIPKVLGLSKWGTPLDAYLELRKEKLEPTETTEDQDRGNFLEPALREWAQKKTGMKFVKPDKTITYADWPWATYSPDGLAPGDDVVLEIKAPGIHTIGEWGAPGTDEVPADYLAQVMWGMMVTGRGKSIIAALIGGELRLYEVLRHAKLESEMLARAKVFVEQHVIPGVPPEPTFGDKSNMLDRWPRNRDAETYKKLSELSVADADVILSYIAAYKNEEQALRILETYEPAVQNIIADTCGIENDRTDLAVPFKRIDWKRNKPSIGVGEAYKMLNELKARMAPAEVAALVAKYLPEEGSRVMKPYFPNPKKK